MSSEADFNKDMNQFIHMLKKILKNYQSYDKQDFSNTRKNSNDINVNLFIFPLIPLTPDEMDELEELYENYIFEDTRGEDLSADLTDSDRDFLRRNGIRF
jgi:hypothetical protein